MKTKTPWEQYAITHQLIRKGPLVDIAEINHIAHVSDARAILRDGTIQTYLVHDESVLNQHRLPVVWLSPNTWAAGSLYGTVIFEFDFVEIFNSAPRLFWVESMNYRPNTARLILSATNLAKKIPNLIELDCSKVGYPLLYQNGTWKRRNEYQYEIMLDCSLSLDKCKRLYFAKHHASLCGKSSNNKRASDCAEKDKAASIRQIACLALSSPPASQINRLLRGDDDYDIYNVVYQIAKDKFFAGTSKVPATALDPLILDLAFVAAAEGYEQLALKALNKLNGVSLRRMINERISERLGNDTGFLEYSKTWANVRKENEAKPKAN